MKAATDPRTPVTILTGWLGAGKTTLLNRLLSQPGGRRFAVLVNEFGEIGVDDRLVRRTQENLVELRNGCVCCTVRGDLLAALDRIHRRGRGRWFRPARPFDRVLIETTGVAEPAPLLRTFMVEATVAARFRTASVVTLVDARNAGAALEERAAREQVAVADRLVLNKIDLVDPGALQKLEARLAAMNPVAERFSTKFAQVDPEVVLADPGVPREWDINAEDEHAHGDIVAVSLREDRPLDELQVRLWLDACVRVLGSRLLRYKGFLRLRDYEERLLLQGVYDLYTAEADESGSGAGGTELVFIGHGLDADFLRKGLEACVSPGG